MHSVWAKQKAFTIVELLIVIVVIAILAAITIVAYTGIQDRAKQAALASAASQASKQIQAYAVENTDLYPPDEATFFSSTNLADTSDTDYTYLTSPDRTHYCISATNPNNPTLSTAVSDTSGGAMEGRCVRNLAWNPGSETAALTLNNGGDALVQRVTSDANTGSAASLLTKGSSYGYLATGSSGLYSYGVGGDTLTISAWVKSSTPSILFTRRGAGVSYVASPKTVSTGVWTRVYGTYTVPIGASSYYMDIGWEASTAGPGSTLRVDSVMVTSGDTLYTYGDGSSSGWSWDGTANNSTSFGPAKVQS